MVKLFLIFLSHTEGTLGLLAGTSLVNIKQIVLVPGCVR